MNWYTIKYHCNICGEDFDNFENHEAFSHVHEWKKIYGKLMRE